MSTPTTTPTAPRSTDAATDATATAQPAAPNSVPNPSFEDGLRALHEQYVEAVNHAVAEERYDLVEHLAAEYTDEAMAALYRVRATQGPRPIARSAADAAREHDEEEDMPNTTISRIPALLRQALRRLDDWTLVAFNPLRYPSPAEKH